MIGQYAAALSSVRRPDTNLKKMLFDDWAFQTRIVMHDASPPIAALPKPKRNRHAGKLAVLHVRRCRSYGVGDEEQVTALHETRLRCRLRREGLAGRRVGRGSDLWISRWRWIRWMSGISPGQRSSVCTRLRIRLSRTRCTTTLTFTAFSPCKLMSRHTRKIKVTVAGAIQLTAWLGHS